MEPGFATDRFSAARRLGAGAYGEVWAVHDRELGRDVALKTLLSPHAAAIYRFKQEFRSLADLSHPNLVQLHELFFQEGRWFFTMELVPGDDFLSAVRRRAGDASAAAIGSAVRPLARQLAEGLNTLHDRGMLHRDLKPSNVRVTPEGRVVILDFGLVTEMGPEHLAETQNSEIVGTPAYMAPEQGSAPLTAAADWYAVGVLLYETLTGRAPFEGSLLQVLVAKQRGAPTPPRELESDVAPDLEALCVELLRMDPAARPSGEDVLRRLGDPGGVARVDDGGDATATRRRGPAFVGRDEHLGRLFDAFAGTREGRAVAVHVHGSSGLGKTSLLRAFAERLRRVEPEAVVLSSRCHVNESVPFRAFDGIIDALTRFLRILPAMEVQSLQPRDALALGRLFPVLLRVDGLAEGDRRVAEIPDARELRRRAFAALRDLFARLAARRPLLLWLDDVQWGDADSAALLAELTREPDAPAMMVALVFRDEEAEASPLLATLAAGRGTASDGRPVDLAVGELASESTLELAAKLLAESRQRPSDAAALAAAIAAEAGGSPLFVTELVRFWSHRVGAPQGTAQGTATLGAVPSLDEALRSRVAELPAAAQRLMKVVAVAGEPARVGIARRAAGLESADLPALQALRVAKLVRLSGEHSEDWIEVYHDRVREALVAELPAAELADWHRRLARELELSGGGEPEALAFHFERSGEPGRAAHHAAVAADAAVESLAFDRAARLYRRALELRRDAAATRGPGSDAAVDRRLLVRLAHALVAAGRGAEAAAAFTAATHGASPVEALELRRCAAEQLLFSGHVDQGLEQLGEVLGIVGFRMPPTPRAALPGLLWRRARLLRWRVLDYRFQERDAQEIAPLELTRIDACWSAAVGLGVVDNIRGAAFQAHHLELALAAGEPYRVARALAIEMGYSATAGCRARKRTDRLRVLTQGLADRLESPHARGLATMVSGLAAYLEGRFPIALEQLDRAEAQLRSECEGVAWELDNAHFWAVRALHMMGDLREVGRRLPRYLAEARERGDLYAETNLRTNAACFARLAREGPEAAVADLDDAIARWSDRGFHVQHFWDLIGRVDADCYAGRGVAAWRRVTEGWPRLRRSMLLRLESTRIIGHLMRGRAALAAAAELGRDGGERRQRLADAAASAGTIRRTGAPWGIGLASLLAAGVARGRERPEAAAMHLRGAVDALDGVPMRLHQGAARWRLAQLVGGAEADELGTAAREAFTAQPVREPERLVDVLAPWPA